MIELDRKNLEKKLCFKLKNNITVLGLDPASRTGWCLISATDNKIKIDYGFLDIDSKDVYFKYDRMIEVFKQYIDNLDSKKDNKLVVIEDVFFGRNINTLKMLARIGMIIYVLATLKGIPKYYILATQARCKLKLKGVAKKKEVQEQFLSKVNLELDDNDIVDAIVLALNGLIEEDTLL